MIMGANIGTSVTNILVALTQAGEREQFRRAFACANVHDMFNWLSAFVLLIVEVTTGYLEKTTGFLVNHMHGDINANVTTTSEEMGKSPDFLKALTKPFTQGIIQLDKNVLQGWAVNDPKYDNSTILKTGCKDEGKTVPCGYLFAYLGPDGENVGNLVIGVLLLTISLFMLCTCLLLMVKTLNSLLGPKVKEIIQNVINSDIPIKGLGWLTGYLAMVLGAIMTILVQSSSVFTSTLTPLAGVGVVSLERAYPMTLGSNLGTTTTSLLASFAAGGTNVRAANQIAFVHLLFNLTGIIIFYPIPFMRWPVAIARVLGSVTAQYRWFAVFYLSFMFFILPTFMFLLSLAGPIPLYLFLVPTISIIIFSVSINILQNNKPKILPVILQSWEFLPLPFHSMVPWDRAVMKALIIFPCCRVKPEIFIPDVVISKPNPESPFPKVIYSNLHNVSSTNSMSGIIARDTDTARNDEEYNLLINYGSETPSPKELTPRGSI